MSTPKSRDTRVDPLGQRFSKAVTQKELDAPQSVGEVPDNLVELARVVEAYGVRGWLKLQPFSLPAATLLKAKQCWLAKTSRSAHAVNITLAAYQQGRVLQAKMHGNYVLMQLAGVNDRSVAEQWKGYSLFMPRERFEQPDEDEFYWVDLEACYVYNEQQQLLGQVREVMDNGAHAILLIHRCSSTSTLDNIEWLLDKKGRRLEMLVPFVKEHVPEVDIKTKKIVTTWSSDF